MLSETIGLCDKCGVRGQIEIMHPTWSGGLTLCGHHGRESWDGLPDGIDIVVSEDMFLWEYQTRG